MNSQTKNVLTNSRAVQEGKLLHAASLVERAMQVNMVGTAHRPTV
jgi:hypothetical protein